MILLARLIVIMTVLAASAFSQEVRATVVGQVVDPSGAMVSGAKVTATNTATNVSLSSTTNDSGNYEIPYLLSGVYRINAEMAGFKRATRVGIELRVSDRMKIDFTLELGNVAESVVVTGETPLIETSSASVGVVMDERRVSELPVVGGNPFYLSRLAPGVLSSGGRSAGNPMDNGAATGIIVNGTRSNSSEVAVDGASNMTNRSAVFSPPQDLVQEFRIQTASYDASIGHAAGAMTNVSMKSGTNGFHGTGYFNDSRIRAVPWFTNRFIYDPNTGPINQEKFDRNVPSWLHRRWGATATGPVYIPKIYNGRNRTFWTFGYEGLQIVRNLTLTATVPTIAQKAGNFSELLRFGSVYQIYDPNTTVPAPNGRFQRQPLPGNIVPASRIDSIAKNILGYYPDPNQPATGDGRNNYFRTRNIDRKNRTLTSRVDHNISENHRLFVRWSNSQHDNVNDFLPTIATGDLLDRTGWTLAVDDVYVFNPQLLLNLRYSIAYQQQWTTRASQGFDLTTLGFSRSLVNEITTKNEAAGLTFPQTVIDGGAYYQLGNNGGDVNATNYQSFGGTVTKMAASHSMKFGAEYRLQRESAQNYGNVAPRFDFAQAWTRGPLDTSPQAPIGQGLASMLLGIPSGGNVNVNASSAQQSGYTGVFFHDDWRITKRLTLNIGLRWEYEAPTTERYDRTISSFDFDTANPVSAQALANYARAPIPEVPVTQFRTTGGLLFAGVGGQPRGAWSGDRNNFAPRFGFAFQITPKTVVRGGYGIFYDVLGVDRFNVNQGGFNQPTNIIPSLDNGQTYVATLANPFPSGIDTPRGSSDGLRTFLGRGASYFYDDALNPYMQRWSFSVQRELPMRTVVEASYVGNRGGKLGVERQLNAIPRQYLSTSPTRDQATIDYLNQQVPNPFFGLSEFAGTGLSTRNVARSQLLRSYPHFTGVTVDYPAGYSYYHSLQVNAEKRMTNGFLFQTSWTYSKFMQATSYLNETDSFLEKVISDQDFTHRIVVSGIYEVPLGKGRKFGSGMNAWANAFAGGWQVQGWFEGQSGDTLGFGNAIFFGNLHDVELPVDQRRAERWFNVDAGFERNNARQLGANIRALNSRFNGIRADGINNWDLSLFKLFRIKEKMTAEFRIESFNSLNHVQFDAPVTGPGNTAFGALNAEKGHGQRQVTLGLKFKW